MSQVGFSAIFNKFLEKVQWYSINYKITSNIVTFPGSCRGINQSLLQFTTQLTSMFHEKAEQSQGCCNITVIVTVVRTVFVYWFILYSTRGFIRALKKQQLDYQIVYKKQ